MDWVVVIVYTLNEHTATQPEQQTDRQAGTDWRERGGKKWVLSVATLNTFLPNGPAENL